MAVEDLTNDHFEYIERSGFVPPAWDGSGPTTHVPPQLRASVRIDGVGRFDKQARPPSEEQPQPPTATLLAAIDDSRNACSSADTVISPHQSIHLLAPGRST